MPWGIASHDAATHHFLSTIGPGWMMVLGSGGALELSQR
jgi:hypothetical protein